VNGENEPRGWWLAELAADACDVNVDGALVAVELARPDEIE
jgi:hypothetical protein